MTSGGQPPAGRWWEGSVQEGKTTGFTTLVCMYICMYNVHAYLHVVGVTSCIVWWSCLLQSTMHGFTLELVAFIVLLHDQHLCVCVCVSVSGTACSSLQLVLSERYSSLSLYNGWDYNDFVTLAHIPIRLVDNFHTLASALSHGAGQVNRETTLVNLLAAVRSVSGCGRCEWVW